MKRKSSVVPAAHPELIELMARDEVLQKYILNAVRKTAGCRNRQSIY